MTRLFASDWYDLINEAAEFDESLDQAYIFMCEDENYSTLVKFFDEENFSHYDKWYDEFVQPDTQAILKKILRGKDTAELIKFALDMGRLVGRAEQILSNQPTPIAEATK